MLQAPSSESGGLLPATNSSSTTTERFSVRWKGFSGNVASALEELHQNGDFADITLVSGDGVRVQCHRLVLSAGSTYFRRILVDVPTACCQHPVIILPDIKGKVLNAIVGYLYNGETNVDHGMLEDFLQSASGLNVKGMVHQYPLDDGQLTPPREEPASNASAPNLALLSQTALTPDLSSVSIPPSFNFLNMQPPLPSTVAQSTTTSSQQQPPAGTNGGQPSNGLSILALAAVTSQAKDKKCSDGDILSVQKLLPRQRMRTEDRGGLLNENDENDPMNSCGTTLGAAMNLSTKDVNSLVSRAPQSGLPSTPLSLNQLRPIAPSTILSSIFEQQQASESATTTCRPIHQPIVPPHLLTIPNPSSVLSLKQPPTLSLTQSGVGINIQQPSPPAQALDMSAHANNHSVSPRPPTSMTTSQVYTSVASPFGGSTGSCGRSVGESPENPPSSIDGGSPIPFTQLGNGHSLVATNSYSNLGIEQIKKERKSKKKLMKEDHISDEAENMDKEERGDKAWKSRQPRSCGHCGRVFSNKFNLKQVIYILRYQMISLARKSHLR